VISSFIEEEDESLAKKPSLKAMARREKKEKSKRIKRFNENTAALSGRASSDMLPLQSQINIPRQNRNKNLLLDSYVAAEECVILDDDDDDDDEEEEKAKKKNSGNGARASYNNKNNQSDDCVEIIDEVKASSSKSTVQPQYGAAANEDDDDEDFNNWLVNQTLSDVSKNSDKGKNNAKPAISTAVATATASLTYHSYKQLVDLESTSSKLNNAERDADLIPKCSAVASNKADEKLFSNWLIVDANLLKRAPVSKYY
jgi:hypothetical protein